MTHASELIQGLRSVALMVPDLQKAEDFFTEIWHLQVCEHQASAIYLRGTGADHHLLSLHPCEGNAKIKQVTLRAHSLKGLQQVAQKTATAGGRLIQSQHAVSEPGGGQAIVVADSAGRVFQIVHGDAVHTATEQRDQPIRLAHVVLNSDDVENARPFFEKAFDFSLADRTRIMAFMRCNSDHHSIALGDTDNNALNHIAFLMPKLDDVMRGGGRMKDAGFDIEWGPGRHGPGNNLFNYFIGPFDLVIEYTTEVQQIDDSYEAGMPEDWKWPAGRVDQWGISKPPSDKLKQAQKAILFNPV
ncbi:MAG: glyoxalase [Limnohabitans sp.]|nr:glyoxalase [Limnohabitans sp.]